MYSAKAPPPRDYAKETRDTLQAQIDLAPELFAAEASEEFGRPAEARLMTSPVCWNSMSVTSCPGSPELMWLALMCLERETSLQSRGSVREPLRLSGRPILSRLH
jgi:hypothetical protein